jgi:hypothetical protein
VCPLRLRLSDLAELFTMAHNLLLLQQQLNCLEASCCPPQLDSVSGATVDNPELAITPRTIYILSYHIMLAHLSSEADQLVLSSAYVDLQTAASIKPFTDDLTLLTSSSCCWLAPLNSSLLCDCSDLVYRAWTSIAFVKKMFVKIKRNCNILI